MAAGSLLLPTVLTAQPIATLRWRIALEINNGSLKVAGPVRAAFEHHESTPGINCTAIDHPLTNDDPFALLFVTPASGIAASVQFQGNKWAICGVFGTLVSDVIFNVLVIKQ